LLFSEQELNLPLPMRFLGPTTRSPLAANQTPGAIASHDAKDLQELPGESATGNSSESIR
jgi:hypothetical protein